MRVCSQPGCPTLIPAGTRGGRCATHERQADRARGTAAQRGYGVAHRKLRAEWEPLVATGNVKCWRCGEYIPAGEPFDLGHDDADRSKYRGPEHQACNRATSSRR